MDFNTKKIIKNILLAFLCLKLLQELLATMTVNKLPHFDLEV